MDSTHDTPQDFRTPERWNSVPVPDRVAERAYTNIDVDSEGCWISRYSVASHGYAQIGWHDTDRGTRMVLAHRAAWVYVNGQMPLGVTLDHICKTRRCVNPDHLRVLPNFENARRVHGMDWPMGYCAQGHPNSLRVPTNVRGNQRRLRKGSICSACRALYLARSKWKARRPGEPMPHDLQLASERGV